MSWNINTIIPAVSFFLYGVLYIIVSSSTPQTDIRRSFRWYLIANLLWSLSGFFVLQNFIWTLFWFRVMSMCILGTMMSISFFTRTLLEKENRWHRIYILYLLVAVSVTLLTDLVIKSVKVVDNVVIEYEFGVLTIVGIPGYLLVITSIISLIREFRVTKDIIQKNRLQYLILGIGIFFAATFLNFTPLGQYPVDIAGNSITALLIAYAILRYHLLDIQVVIRQGLLYSIPTIFIGAAYFLVISLALNLFNLYSGFEIFVLSLIVAVIAALLAEPIRSRAQTIIDRLFFREKYDSKIMLQRLSSRVASVLDLNEVTDIILEEINTVLHIPQATFFLRKENGFFQIANQIGNDQNYHIEFRNDHPLIMWLSTHDHPLYGENIKTLPQFQSLWQREHQDLEKLNAELFIPVKVQSELVGLFSVGTKRSEQVYDEEDKLTLSTLANQTAVAIENARLYTAEQTRRKELDTLFSMARQLVATDHLETVLESVATHAVESINVTYARVLTRNDQGDYICRAVYPAHNLNHELGLGRIEPIVAEHYYNWILQREKPVVIHRDSMDLHIEEKRAIFFNEAKTLCLSPLIGVDEHIGLLILGEVRKADREPFDVAKLRMVEVISDHATSAIQRAILHEQLEENFLQTVVSLANAMDARDTYTRDHSQRMADLSTKLSFELELSESQIEAVHWAALLHDIGKIGVPDEILNKPGSLTKKEWEIMKQHPVIGSKIVAPIKMLAPVAPIILSHHERYDGSGYPNGLKEEEIPLEARILAVVDAYIAIRDDRIYNKAHTHEEAIAEIRSNSGTQFDPVIVDAFCKLFKHETFPE